MKLQKKEVYVPVFIPDEFPQGEVCAINAKGDMLVGRITEDNDGECESDTEVLPLPEYWLKKQTSYVFSEEELREFAVNLYNLGWNTRDGNDYIEEWLFSVKTR